MQKKWNILVVEDDPQINELLQIILQKNDMQATAAYSGTEAQLLLENHTYDLILVDLMLPGVSGGALIINIRETSNIPIIVISAKTAIEDKVKLLKAGADDFITKPFNDAEVIARIEVQLRKTTANSTHHASWRGLKIDEQKRHITLYDTQLTLTNAEYDILSLLIAQPEYAFSKREIYERLWTGPYVGDDNTISVHMSNIRKKIAVHTEDEYIKTVWGIGFMLV